jgi:hypothetical protein
MEDESEPEKEEVEDDKEEADEEKEEETGPAKPTVIVAAIIQSSLCAMSIFTGRRTGKIHNQTD